MVARKLPTGFGGSVEDLAEYDPDLDRLVFPEGTGIRLDGTANNFDLYNDGSNLCESIVIGTPGAADPAADANGERRLITKRGVTTIAGGVISLPETNLNQNHAIAGGYGVLTRALYLGGSASSGAQLIFADHSDLDTNSYFQYTHATRLLQLRGDGVGSFVFGDAGDKLGFWNTTAVVQPSHLSDPSGTTELETYCGDVNADVFAATGLTKAS